MPDTTISQNTVTALDETDHDFSVLHVVKFLLQYWRWIVVPAVVFGLALSLPRLFKERMYKSTSRFILRGQGLPSGGLNGVAAQFGLTLPGSDPTQSPDFYADVATSRPVIGQVVDTRYIVHDADGTHTGTLVDLLKVDEKTPILRREALIDKIGKILKVEVNRKILVVDVTVTTHWPGLSRDVNERILQLVNVFNLQVRQSSAENELKFTESRLADAGATLRSAEGRLEAFMQANRETMSPTLALQSQRLQREVAFRQDLYTTLAQNAEQARMNAERDTPVITVLENANFPVRPESRQVVLYAFLGVIIGGVIGLICAYIRVSMRDLAQRRPEEIAVLRAAVSGY